MKQKKIFSCQNCGYQSPKWLGKCTECQQWNSFAEEIFTPAQEAGGKGLGVLKENLQDFLSDSVGSNSSRKPLTIDEIHTDQSQRFKTHFQEFDRVLGGGIVPGSLILIGGDPGIGKSTILLQSLISLGRKILYVSGEESAQQIKLRALRLGVKDQTFFIFAENNFEKITDEVKNLKPEVLIIDSIQTIFTNQVTSAPGSVSQIRECTGKLMILAKTLGVATFVVGHITKEGSIAGPKVLEHIVDTVLYFENSSSHVYRLLRAVKNRFGSTNEIGVFEMSGAGLREVLNPSELFLEERPQNSPGSVVVGTVEGTRTLLVEIQALVSQSVLATPRRTCIGVDHNKVSLLIAVIEKKLGLPLYGHDIFVNVAGGLELDEPASDLGVALALISNFQNKPLNPKLMVCGEIGLAGEMRNISHLEQRLAECHKLGFKYALCPKSSLDRLKKSDAYKAIQGMEVVGAQTLEEGVRIAFEI